MGTVATKQHQHQHLRAYKQDPGHEANLGCCALVVHLYHTCQHCFCLVAKPLVPKA